LPSVSCRKDNSTRRAWIWSASMHRPDQPAH
jgi:hypothetical protein